MKPFCEIVVTSVLPAVRSIITKNLLEIHHLTQQQAADLLGLTQPAISQYHRESRGFKAKLLEKEPKIIAMIDDLTEEIISKSINPKDIQARFCRICEKVRKGRLICRMHEDIYPSIAPCLECPKC